MDTLNLRTETRSTPAVLGINLPAGKSWGDEGQGSPERSGAARAGVTWGTWAEVDQ